MEWDIEFVVGNVRAWMTVQGMDSDDAQEHLGRRLRELYGTGWYIIGARGRSPWCLYN